MKVTLLAWTHFDQDAARESMEGFETDADGGQALAEAAGRACYRSFKKPNPATATNAGYLAHILDVGHLSVLEHGSVTFYFTGISRSLTHELIRHRHFSYSQLSQRYVPEHDAAMVTPQVIAADPQAAELFNVATEKALWSYTDLVNRLDEVLSGRLPDSTSLRKQVRQAARSVLPNATETRIVVTGNYRAWRHFIGMRATEAADVEIRALAVQCLWQLQRVAPNVFADFKITPLPDGTDVAASTIVAPDIEAAAARMWDVDRKGQDVPWADLNNSTRESYRDLARAAFGEEVK